MGAYHVFDADQIYMTTNIFKYKNIESTSLWEFIDCPKPKISIVIPYNNLKYLHSNKEEKLK